MIRIKLDISQKNKINELINDFIKRKDIINKIDRLSRFLRYQKCIHTANILQLKAKSNLFVLFGRNRLEACAEEFELAMHADKKEKGIDINNIINFIYKGNASKKKRVSGFGNFYDSFSNSDEAYEILKIINSNVCPYCNRQYTFTVSKKGLRTRPQFDHFYPKSLYPYLAISVYNLIPSCPLCNMGKSSSAPDNILYPYEEDFDSKNINFKIEGIVPFILGAAPNINVNLESAPVNKPIIKTYNKEMKISVLYEGHSKYIKDLIEKKRIFNDDVINDICSLLPKHCLTPQYVEQLIFGQYDIAHSIDNPLSKLTRDVLNQL